MAVHPLAKLIDPKNTEKIQSYQYRESLIISGSAPVGQPFPAQVQVSALGPFYSLVMKGTYETLYNTGAGAVDVGVNYLSGQLSDPMGNRVLFNARIPFDILFTPGRRKTMNSGTYATDPVGNNLFYPCELEYLWPANSLITFDVFNASNVALAFEIVFEGIRLVDAPGCK